MRINAECERITVDSWSDSFVYGRLTAGDGNRRVKVALQSVGGDWSYLVGMLSEGSQLNLVRPSVMGVADKAENTSAGEAEKTCREDDASVCELAAEYIIFEPDYLINISTIAACFEDYAEDAVVDLVRKIRPNQSTYATTLGNFASQLLDESVNHAPGTLSYAQSAVEFFRSNALPLTLLSSEESVRFHEEAQQQRANISNAMHLRLPSLMQGYDPRLAIVEPSFFSEMLGIQGRMDYLQADFRLLLEQKSGKGGFPQRDFTRPLATRQHNVQLLLYMMIVRYNFARSSASAVPHSFLLYSKYSESLLRLPWSPQLVFDAVRVRNQLAWRETGYAMPDGFRQLERMTADSFNLRQSGSKLWTNYVRPDLDSLLSVIHTATPLERDYFFRFMTFIAREHSLGKVGNREKDNGGFALKWHLSLAEKLAEGSIYASLRLVAPSSSAEPPIESLRFAFPASDACSSDATNFRVGDIVAVYPYDEGTEPDIRRSMVFRCTIASITDEDILLHLRSPQSNANVFLKDAGRPWAVEHDFFEASFSGLYRGMYSFLSAPQERRDLLLFQRKPMINKDIKTLRETSHGSFSDLALRVKQAQDFFLIIGPPGTGKTSFGLVTTLREELAEEGSSVLLMAYTNRAVDEICDKLMEEGIDFLRIGGQFTASARSRSHLLSERVSGVRNTAELKAMLLGMRVYVGTTTALSSSLALFQHKQFSLAIIDEASQILEPHLMPLLSACAGGEAAIRKFVMIGDHKQLPAVVQQSSKESSVSEPSLREILLTDCRLSLFERLLKRYRHDPRVVYMLTRQGRMHPDIALFANRHFYGDALTAVPLKHQRESLSATACEDLLQRAVSACRVAFVAVQPAGADSCPALQSSSSSEPSAAERLSDKVNPQEAEIIAAMVSRICRLHPDMPQPEVARLIGIIVPYRNQISAVRSALSRHDVEGASDITIDTVERYQGSQRDYIIYGFTVSKPYQLRFLADNVFEEDGMLIDRKLNVAMTRARKHLVLVGNPAVLSGNPTFPLLMDFCKERGAYFEQ